MSSSAVDVILPVWNRPRETRECLAALVEHSGDTRLILLDLGSDSETEQILHDFAEFLGERAILFRSERMKGFVETVNRGLSAASAPLMIVLRVSSRVTSGWLTPLRHAAQETDAGVLVPCLAHKEGFQLPLLEAKSAPAEASHGTFSAIGVTRRLYETIGDFDAGLDGGMWCLKDYSRRAAQAGFRTLHSNGPPVLFREEVVYGSAERRTRLLSDSAETFAARWGEENRYCLRLSRAADKEMLAHLFGVILQGARRGHRFFVLSPPAVYRRIVEAGLHRLHENISLERVTRFSLSRSGSKVYAALRARHPAMKLLGGADGLLVPGGEESIPFSVMENVITTVEV